LLQPPSPAAGILEKFSNIIYFDNWLTILVIETRTGILILSPIIYQFPFFRNRVLVNIFHFLNQEFFRENVLCLYILPYAVFFPSVTTLFMEKSKKLLVIVTSQLMENGMGCERCIVLQKFTNRPADREDNSMKVGWHQYKSKKVHTLFFSQPCQGIYDNFSICGIGEELLPTAYGCSNEI
jgi:hypothetical protein